MTLFWLGAAWLAGIAAGRIGGLLVWQWLVLAALSLAASVVFWRLRGWRWSFACVAVAAMGAGRYQAATPPLAPQHIAAHNDCGQYRWITGVVVDFPDVRDSYVGLRIEVESVRASWGENEPAHGLVLVRAPVHDGWSRRGGIAGVGCPETVGKAQAANPRPRRNPEP